MGRPRNKYNARKVEIDGHTFDSVKEGKRYGVLKVLERAGHIENLELQPKIDCVVNGEKVCSYRADFRYLERGEPVYEDVKGVKTPVYKLKRKLVRACTGIEVKET